MAPTLIDSIAARQFTRVLDALPLSAVEQRPRLAMARCRERVMARDHDAARRWCAIALARAGPDSALRARLYWELGCLALAEGQVDSAELTLALAAAELEQATKEPDLAHLAALIGEQRSKRAEALRDYRRAIVGGDRALTLVTRVIALKNLASAVCQDDPRSASGHCALALALIDGDALDERVRPSVENVLARSLLCSGLVQQGLLRAQAAALDARRQGHHLIESYARFQESIALELLAEIVKADEVLASLADTTTKLGYTQLHGWCAIRRSWLSLERHHSREVVATQSPLSSDAVFADAVSTLRAIADLHAGRLDDSIQRLGQLVERYVAAEDWLTAFVLLLWMANAHDKRGDPLAAQSAIRAAVRIGQPRAFRISPNWWSADLVRVVQKHAIEGDRPYAGSLLYPGGVETAPGSHQVTVATSGNIAIDGHTMPETAWRVGRTGSRVLRRTFRLLVVAHPAGIDRQELADLLWPESDGDRAILNLDSALNDLRRLLREVPGLTIAAELGRYRLSASQSARIEQSARAIDLPAFTWSAPSPPQ